MKEKYSKDKKENGGELMNLKILSMFGVLALIFLVAINVEQTNAVKGSVTITVPGNNTFITTGQPLNATYNVGALGNYSIWQYQKSFDSTAESAVWINITVLPDNVSDENISNYVSSWTLPSKDGTYRIRITDCGQTGGGTANITNCTLGTITNSVNVSVSVNTGSIDQALIIPAYNALLDSQNISINPFQINVSEQCSSASFVINGQSYTMVNNSLDKGQWKYNTPITLNGGSYYWTATAICNNDTVSRTSLVSVQNPGSKKIITEKATVAQRAQEMDKKKLLIGAILIIGGLLVVSQMAKKGK